MYFRDHFVTNAPSGTFGLLAKHVQVAIRTDLQDRRTEPRARQGYLEHVQRRDYPGGYFFASVAAEVGSRPGPVRDLIAAEHDAWIGLLADQARRAAEGGELPAGSDPVRLAIELGAMLTGADIAYLLHDDPRIIDTVRTAVNTRLATEKPQHRHKSR
jgi:hypothetical protein